MMRFGKHISSSRYFQRSISDYSSQTCRKHSSLNTKVNGSNSNAKNIIKVKTVTTDNAISAFSKEASIAPLDFPVQDRWKVVLPATAIHLSIGSVYVYSMWTPGLTTALGVVGSAPLDWTHTEMLPVFRLVLTCRSTWFTLFNLF